MIKKTEAEIREDYKKFKERLEDPSTTMISVEGYSEKMSYIRTLIDIEEEE